MNIKRLLFGSAIILTMAPTAKAEDAVIAAASAPQEYVGVCDAYGTGYFTIPGTETCLKVGGSLRYETRLIDGYGRWKDDHGSNLSLDIFDNHSRANVDVSAKTDTEWGTVYSWIRLQGDQVNNKGSNPASRIIADKPGTSQIYKQSNSDITWYYYFGIGGLEFGNYDSMWVKFMGYGGRTDDGGIDTTDFYYEDSRQYVAYTFDFGNYKAFISLDNDADEFFTEDGFLSKGEQHGVGPAAPGHKYLPDISAGVSAVFGDFSTASAIAYDESDESFARKSVVRGDIGWFGVTAMWLHSQSSENIYFAYEGSSAIVGLSAKLGEPLSIASDVQWFDNGDWRVVGDVEWRVASGFSVLLEGIYVRPDFGTDTKQGMLRFQRSF